MNNVVHVVDDDEAVRESLSFLLSAAGYETETYGSAQEFLDRLPDLDAGCLVTDVRMPGMNGIELMRRVIESEKPIPVIVVTGHGDIPLAVEAMKVGAVEFLEKPFDERKLLKAVDVAVESNNRSIEEAAVRGEFQSRFETLSNRERQVFRGLLAGHQNKTIARDLGISPRTVEVYRANVMGKMRAGSLSELVRMSLLAGLGDSSDDLPTPE